MTWIAIPGLTYNGHAVAYDDGVVTVPPPPPPPPPPPSEPNLPREVANRYLMRGALSWRPYDPRYTRIVSPAALDNSNVWIVRFTTGPTPTSYPRLQFVEADATQPPVLRNGVLLRDRDGAELARYDDSTGSMSTSLTIDMAFYSTEAYKPSLEPNSGYTMVLWNRPGTDSAPSKLSAELYI